MQTTSTEKRFSPRFFSLAQPYIGEVPEGTSATYFEIVR